MLVSLFQSNKSTERVEKSHCYIFYLNNVPMQCRFPIETVLSVTCFMVTSKHRQKTSKKTQNILMRRTLVKNLFRQSVLAISYHSIVAATSHSRNKTI